MPAEPPERAEAGEPARCIRVLIAEDEELVRAGLRALVASAPDLEVVGEAATGTSAVSLARQTQPDVVLMDLRMPVMDGLEATRHLLAGPGPVPRVLVVTTFDEDEHVFAALRHGASGFVLKDTRPEQLLEAIRLVARGEALLSPQITRRLITHFVTRTPVTGHRASLLADLTGREREVLEQIATGRSNTEIAQVLHVSLPTVKTHVGRLLAKLQARDRAQLVVLAYESGLVAVEEQQPPPDARSRFRSG